MQSMDYQRNGWFRPTCGVNRAQGAPYHQQASARTAPTPVESCENHPHIHPTTLAMVWSPVQSFQKIYEPSKALMRGTLFAELDKPFTGKC